jgi:hypothetical protein
MNPLSKAEQKQQKYKSLKINNLNQHQTINDNKWQ